MEIALPLLGLGAMYIMSNQNQSSNQEKPILSKEKFSNMGKSVNYLPNVDPIQKNFPVFETTDNSVKQYPNPNAATDKYFDQSSYEKKSNTGMNVGQNPAQIHSLTGNYLNSKEFVHTNMNPLNGGKPKGHTYNMNTAENVLDNMIGTGSQLTKKVEQAPLFKPQEHMQYAYGAPNQSDFFQSRENLSLRNNNVKPFESENVGPGLGLGYTTNGSGGFNSGMEDRASWLPKTVDELRVDTNPKLEYDLLNHEGPANAYIKNTGIIGRVEKQLPDTFFINTQDRWLTTTGIQKGGMLRSLEDLKNVKRPDCAVNYSGPALSADKIAGYVPSGYEKSKRVQSATCDVAHGAASGRGPIENHDKLNTFTNYSTNRSASRQVDTIRSGFSGAVGAVIAPLMDILRPSRKEEVCANVRIYGEVGTAVPSSYVINPKDTAPTTVKEMTMYSTKFNINNQKEGIYVNTHVPLELTQRDTMNCSTYGAVGGAGNSMGAMNYDAAYIQTNNDIKSQTIDNRTNHGVQAMFNSQMNVNLSKEDTSRTDGYVSTPYAPNAVPPSKEQYGKISAPQYYDQAALQSRLDGDLLSAFRQNPYTHSLNSAV